MKLKIVVGLLIIAVFGAWSIHSFMSTTIRYVPLADVAQTNGAVQVMGKIDFNSVSYDTNHAHLIFEISDLEHPESNRRLKVIYSGTVPGNFDQATSVVAKGTYRDGALQANQLLIKCPSKYQGLDQGA